MVEVNKLEHHLNLVDGRRECRRVLIKLEKAEGCGESDRFPMEIAQKL